MQDIEGICDVCGTCTLREEGREEGLALGENRMARMNELYSILVDMGRFDDLKRATKDTDYREQIMSEMLPEA